MHFPSVSQDEDASVTRACISNRSACFIQLERFHEAEADCSRALELLGDRIFEPEREGNSSNSLDVWCVAFRYSQCVALRMELLLRIGISLLLFTFRSL
jgi:hypothetical protein